MWESGKGVRVSGKAGKWESGKVGKWSIADVRRWESKGDDYT